MLPINPVHHITHQSAAAKVHLSFLTKFAQTAMCVLDHRALAIPKEGTTTGEDGESEVPIWMHMSGQTSMSLLDSLYVRDEQLESALEKCVVEEVAPGIVAAAQEEQKAHKENLERVQMEDDERRAKEAAAAAKAGKKKKGKGGKKK